MSEKKNYWTQAIGTQDALIQFGGVSSEKDVTSSFKVRALDGRHFYTMDQDGQRKGWTTLVSPGATQVITGEDLEKGQNAIYVEAENGDIIIKATDGNIRFEGDKIDFVAREEFNVESHGKIDVNAQNINVEARFGMKIKASSFLNVNAPCGMEIISGIIRGVSCASERSASFLDF